MLTFSQLKGVKLKSIFTLSIFLSWSQVYASSFCDDASEEDLVVPQIYQAPSLFSAPMKPKGLISQNNFNPRKNNLRAAFQVVSSDEICEIPLPVKILQPDTKVKVFKATKTNSFNWGEQSFSGKEPANDAAVFDLVVSFRESGVEYVNLSKSGIRLTSAINLAIGLKDTLVHTLNLSENFITDPGAIGFAQNLHGTHVRKMTLMKNNISSEAQEFLKTEYPYIEWVF